jgi:D-alanine-D-alanine ligase-like ATP-grasp enzyme
LLELVLNEGTNAVYDHEKKFKKTRPKKVKKICPADLPKETAAYIQKLAVQTFDVLNTYDFGRVDFRLDQYNQPYILDWPSF